MRRKAGSGAIRWLPALAVALASAAGSAARAEDAVAAGILEGVQEARAQAGVPALERRPGLDAAAARRAREAAGRPEGRRFAHEQPIDVYVRDAGIKRFARAGQYLATQGGYDDDVEAALRIWKGYGEGWTRALDPAWTAVGVATVPTPDDLLVVAVVFLEDEHPVTDEGTMVERTFEATNAERLERGLGALVWNETLAAVAREHSLDMARRGYVGHDSPEGLRPVDRARAAGIEFRGLAENVATNLHMEDPVAAAVSGWLESPPHRRNLLDPDFTQTGIGVAVDEDGQVIFTQMFLLPAARGDESSP